MPDKLTLKVLLASALMGVTMYLVARALARRFHLHPSASRWFPEAGNISQSPRYSRWTDKRVVQIEEVWPDRLQERARPAGLVQLERIENGLVFEPLDRMNTLNTLLCVMIVPVTLPSRNPALAGKNA